MYPPGAHARMLLASVHHPVPLCSKCCANTHTVCVPMPLSICHALCCVQVQGPAAAHQGGGALRVHAHPAHAAVRQRHLLCSAAHR